MLNKEEAEKIVKRFSPTTKLTITKCPGREGIYMGKTNEIIITHDWNIAGLLHEITHARLYLDGRNYRRSVDFAHEFTKIVGEYLEDKVDVAED